MDSRQTFEKFFALSQDMLAVADLHGHFTLVNPSWERVLGYSARELLSGPYIEMVHPDDREATRAAAARLNEEGVLVSFVNRNRRRDGGWRWLDWSARRDPDSGLTYAVARDITGRSGDGLAERARMESKLRETSGILESISSSSSLANFMLDRNRNVLFWSVAAERIYGWSASEVLGKPVPFLDANEVSRSDTPCIRALRGEALPGVEVQRRRKDGNVIDLSLSAGPVHDARGEIVGSVYVAADITQDKKLRAQLAHSDRLAAIGTLAAGVVHEINNPLTYVTSNLSLALEDLKESGKAGGRLPEELRDPLRKLVACAAEGTERVRGIVRGLKTFSRNDDEKVGTVELRKVLESVLSMASHEIWPRARVVRDFDRELMVRGNEGRLGQVFLNLVINAAQAIAEGASESNSITIRAFSRPGDLAAIEIADTGCGMPPHVRAQLFNPFFTTKPQGVGTGLGLSICHGIVTGLGGRIEVESEVAKGTTFRVLLPLASQSARARRKCAAAAAPCADAASPAPGRARILILDDEIHIADALGKILRRDQHEVEAFTDAAEAFRDLLTGRCYDLVFCDLMMPGMTGMDIYEGLQRARPGMEKRLIFMTGGAFTPRSREFLQEIPNRFIEKPFTAQSIRDIVSRVKAAR